MDRVTRDNHFVPQGYLRRWAHAEGRIWTYRLLVSHASVPEWAPRPIKGVAFQRDLYTSISGSAETDEFEKWMEAEVETPGLRAIERATTGALLSKADWNSLALYFAAQEMRTPLSYLEAARRWHQELPDLMDSTLRSAVHGLEKGSAGTAAPGIERAPVWFKESFRVTVQPDADPKNGMGAVQLEAVVGRPLWLGQQQYLMETAAKVLTRHKWGIGEAAPGYEWLTSDHPALNVGYAGPDSYSFAGGWGRPKANLFLPISPRHMLFCQVGDHVDDCFRFSAQRTRLLQRLIAERAHRLIFSRMRNPSAVVYKPRTANAEAFRAEQLEWNRWHETQIAGERWDE